jgi:BMFP domain-containing protein YqiC
MCDSVTSHSHTRRGVTLVLEAEIRSLVSAHLDEVVADLDHARHNLAHHRTEVAELERRVAHLEGLLALVQLESEDPEQSGGKTLHQAMVEVLRDASHGLRAGDLASEINRRRLYRMRDGRPVEAQQIHARVGNYGHLFKKVGTLIELAD